MKLKILVLDDDPQRHAAFATQGKGHAIDHVWFVDHALRKLGETKYDLVCLDNDLDTEGYEREGFEVADRIAAMPKGERPGAVLVHSWNPPRADQMVSTLRTFYAPGETLLRSEFGEFVVLPPDECRAPVARGWVRRSSGDVMKDVPESVQRDWFAEERRVNPSPPCRIAGGLLWGVSDAN